MPTLDYLLSLQSFALHPGETTEKALSRAIDLHIHDTSFSDILKHVNDLVYDREHRTSSVIERLRGTASVVEATPLQRAHAIIHSLVMRLAV